MPASAHAETAVSTSCSFAQRARHRCPTGAQSIVSAHTLALVLKEPAAPSCVSCLSPSPRAPPFSHTHSLVPPPPLHCRHLLCHHDSTPPLTESPPPPAPYAYLSLLLFSCCFLRELRSFPSPRLPFKQKRKTCVAPFSLTDVNLPPRAFSSLSIRPAAIVDSHAPAPPSPSPSRRCCLSASTSWHS